MTDYKPLRSATGEVCGMLFSPREIEAHTLAEARSLVDLAITEDFSVTEFRTRAASLVGAGLTFGRGQQS